MVNILSMYSNRKILLNSKLMRAKVLIAGSGNTTGINVIKSLIDEVEVIGCDFNPINPANKFCRNFAVSRCSSSLYNKDILELIRNEGVTHIFASNDHDVRAMTLLSPELEKLGVRLNGVNGSVTIDCLDKDKTYKLFVENNILTPKKVDVRNALGNIPCVVRIKNMGKTRKFVHIVKTKENFAEIPQTHLDNAICTCFVEGEEYTTDYLCDNESNLICAIPRLRVEVNNGMVWHGKVVHDEVLIQKVTEVAKKLGLIGVGCIQCIKDKFGNYYFIEINPRPGSGIDLSINSGANLPLMSVYLQQGIEVKVPMINWDTQMIRYNTAYFFS